ncbi:hypothetical protein U3516DRAFT_772395 [Neocallimastix sp. 'constans']
MFLKLHNIIELNEICITININFVSVKLVDFITTIIEYTLISGNILLDEAMTNKSKNDSFGFNAINIIPDDHNDLKFFVSYNACISQFLKFQSLITNHTTSTTRNLKSITTNINTNNNKSTITTSTNSCKDYYLHIKDEDNIKIGVSVTLYYGLGVKHWEIKVIKKIIMIMLFNINGNKKADYEFYDQYIDKIIKILNTNTMEMNRTTWSSNRANIDLYDCLYNFFSSLDIIILMVKSNYSIWYPIKPLAFVGLEILLNGYKLYLTTINQKYGIRYNFIDSEQFRFRNRKEKVNLYISNWDISKRCQNNNEVIYLAFLVLNKAYDSVSIVNILTELKCLGCPLSLILFKKFNNEIFKIGIESSCGPLLANEIVLFSIIKSVTMVVFPNTLIQIDSIDLRILKFQLNSKEHMHKSKLINLDLNSSNCKKLSESTLNRSTECIMDIKRYNNEKTFYPWSVVQALNSKSIENYYEIYSEIVNFGYLTCCDGETFQKNCLLFIFIYLYGIDCGPLQIQIYLGAIVFQNYSFFGIKHNPMKINISFFSLLNLEYQIVTYVIAFILSVIVNSYILTNLNKKKYDPIQKELKNSDYDIPKELYHINDTIDCKNLKYGEYHISEMGSGHFN